MSTTVTTVRVNHHYLMNKSKWDLASWIMDDFDRIDNLEEEVAKLKAEIDKMDKCIQTVSDNSVSNIYEQFCAEWEKE
jgi:peptidoglycan hydrolase CwlO-like protein